MISWVSRNVATACVNQIVGTDTATDAAIHAAQEHGHMSFVWSMTVEIPILVATALDLIADETTMHFTGPTVPRPRGKSKKAVVWELTHPAGVIADIVLPKIKDANNVANALEMALSPRLVETRALFLHKLCKRVINRCTAPVTPETTTNHADASEQDFP